MKITDILHATKAAHIWFECGCQVDAVLLESDDLRLNWTMFKGGEHHYMHCRTSEREEIKRALRKENPQMPIDLGKLTPEETANLALKVIKELTEEQIFELLDAVLTHEQKGELAVAWENE